MRELTAKPHIARAFSRAAESYDDAAEIQRQVAEELDRRIADLDLPARPRILEIGCGTGFLSRHLRDRFPASQILLIDIAPGMIARCRELLGDFQPLTFAVMDGERPAIHPDMRFDLICSSLSFQWFETPAASFERLAHHLTPGGHLVFSTLGNESFREWRNSGRFASDGLRRFPDLPAWRQMAPPPLSSRFSSEERRVSYPNAITFLRSLREIGATTPPLSHHPASAGALRRQTRRFAAGIDVTWHIVYGLCRNPD